MAKRINVGPRVETLGNPRSIVLDESPAFPMDSMQPSPNYLGHLCIQPLHTGKQYAQPLMPKACAWFTEPSNVSIDFQAIKNVQKILPASKNINHVTRIRVNAIKPYLACQWIHSTTSAQNMCLCTPANEPSQQWLSNQGLTAVQSVHVEDTTADTIFTRDELRKPAGDLRDMLKYCNM